MPRKLFALALLAMVMMISGLAAPSQAASSDKNAKSSLPSKQAWLKDTRSAMYGSRAYIDKRVSQGGAKLAVNFDIDNSSLATHYAPRTAIPVVLRFAKYADTRGVALVFNTGRLQKDLAQPLAWLRKAGYPVAGICGRRQGEGLVAGKQRCRKQYVDAGYTIVANVGNRSTDFVGTGYGRAFKLPNYHNLLG